MVAKSYISSLFGKSPIRPLQEHMAGVYEGITHLVPLVQAMNHKDEAAVVAAHQKIVASEHAADVMKKALRHHLPRSLFMPMDRRDLLDVLLMQDKIINLAKDVAGLIVGRKMVLDTTLQEPFLQFTMRCTDAVKQALEIINELDDLLESGFRGREVGHVEAMIQTLDKIENETDQMQAKLRQQLFSLEDSLRPTDVMFTYRLIDWMGNVADDAQRVGSRLQLMLAN
ncbi:TIGR00153 family protein [Thiofilum flexile]|uniref:TIGR00153 family protein n=1 Tax=Thiofilum flexile TaxID=125627 RepID=UPI00037F7177|nr:TIGR00153 family protein [Thiofilum flexile]